MRKKLNDTDKIAIGILAHKNSIEPCFAFEMHGLCQRCPITKFPDFDCTISLVRKIGMSKKTFVQRNEAVQKRKLELCFQYLVDEWGEDRAKQIIVEELI
jgi:hypothetical protein